MKHLKANKARLAVIISALLLVVLAVGTFAWFQKNYNVGGLDVETGRIGVTVTTYSYDASSNAVSKVAETSTPAASTDILVSSEATYKQIDEQPATFFVKIKKDAGTIDAGYGLSLYLEGLLANSDTLSDDIVYAGGFWYHVTQLSDATVKESTELVDMAAQVTTPAAHTELLSINDALHTGKVTDADSTDYYMITVGKYDATGAVPAYSERKLRMHAQVEISQYDYTPGNKSKVYNVFNATDLETALSDYRPGEIIQVNNDITFSRDLVFNRPVNLRVNNGYTLTIEGNLIFSFNSTEACEINTTGGGHILVKQNAEAGGMLQIDTPSSEFTLKGTNSLNYGAGDIYVQRTISLSASYDKGLIIDGCNIFDTTISGGIPQTDYFYKDIFLGENAYLHVVKGTKIGNVLPVDDTVTYLGITNNGTISGIDLGSMKQDESGRVNMPQIKIHNNGMITDSEIILPYWSVKYEEINGVPQGNTTIIQDLSGNSMTVSGAQVFDNDDIVVINPDRLVEKLDAKGERLVVYYYDKTGEKQSLQSLLEDFFANEKDANGANLYFDIATGAKTVTYLKVITASDKFLTEADYGYIRQSLTSIESLDLSEAYTERVEIGGEGNEFYVGGTRTAPEKLQGKYAHIRKEAFAGISTLKHLLLPGNTQTIGMAFVKGTSLTEISIPSTVIATEIQFLNANTNTHTSAFHTVRYVRFENSADVVKGLAGRVTDNEITWPIFMVPASLEAAYEAHYASQFTASVGGVSRRIVPDAILVGDDVTGDGVSDCEYLVREVGTDAWEIVFYYGGATAHEPTVIGSGITYNGRDINIVGVYDHAFYTVYKKGTTALSFAPSVSYVGNYSFYSLITAASGSKPAVTGSVVSLDLSGLETIGNSAFEYLKGYEELNSNAVLSVGDNAFNHISTLTLVDLPNCLSIGAGAFQNCVKLTDARADACTSISGGAFMNCSELVVAYFPKAETVGASAFVSENGKLRLLVIGRPGDLSNFGSAYAVNTSNPYFKVIITATGPAPSSFAYTGLQNLDLMATFVMQKSAYESYEENNCFSQNVEIIPDEYFNVDRMVLANGKSIAEATSADFSGAGYLFAPCSEEGYSLIGSTTRYIDFTADPIPQQITDINGQSQAVVRIGSKGMRGVEISGTNQLSIPGAIKTVGDMAFYQAYFASSVTDENKILNFGSGLSVIENNAFKATEFTVASFPSTITNIGAEAFVDSGLTTVQFATGIGKLHIGDKAFYSLEIASLTIPGEVTFGNSVFETCNKLETVMLPDAIEIDCIKLFYGCYNLKSVSCNNLKTISGGNNFQECELLTSINMPNLQYLNGSNQFMGNTDRKISDKITNIHFPELLVISGNQHFSYLENLDTVTMEKLTAINGLKNFSGNSALRIIEMSSLHTISETSSQQADGNFYNCSNLRRVEFGVLAHNDSTWNFQNTNTANAVMILNGSPINSITGTGSAWFNTNSFTDSMVIGPVGTQALYDTKFANRYAALPTGASTENLEFYGEYTNTKGVKGDKYLVHQWDDGTFTLIYCLASSLTSAELQSDLAAMKTEFGDLRGIGRQCFHFTSFTDDGILDFSGYTKLTTLHDNAFYQRTTVKQVILPNTVTELGANVFNGCKALTAVSAPGVTTIGTQAFQGCTYLAYVKLGSLTTIGSNPFAATKGGVVWLTGDGAACTGTLLSGTAHFSGGVVLMSANAEQYYKSITNNRAIVLSAGETVTGYGTTTVGGITLDKYLYTKDTATGKLVLLRCLADSLTVTELMNDLAAIETQAGMPFGKIVQFAFRYTAISGDTLTIPTGVTEIQNNAFDYSGSAAHSIKSLNTSNVESIGKEAFKSMTITDTITFGAPLHTIGSNAFTKAGSTININAFDPDATAISVTAGQALFGTNATLHVNVLVQAQYENGWANIAADKVETFGDVYTDDNAAFYFVDDGNGGFRLIKILHRNTTFDRLVIPTEVSGKKVTQIDPGAFKQMAELTNIKTLVLPDHLEANAFADYDYTIFLQYLTAFEVGSGSVNYATDAAGVLFNKSMTKLILYPMARQETSYSIPSGVTIITSFAFDGAKYLLEIAR